MSFDDHQAGLPIAAAALSAPEKICLTLVAEGRKPPEISRALAITEADVEDNLLKAQQKLGASNRLHAVSLALLQGIVSDSPSR